MSKVLVIDDDLDLIEVISLYLEKVFDTILVANDVPKAIACLKEDSSIDFVITDLNLITGSGDSVIKYMRIKGTRYCETPVLVISGERSFETSTYKKCLFLGKPFNDSELLAKINELKSDASATKKPQASKKERTGVHPNLKKILKN